jgi:chromosome segregation ATPase
MTDNQIVPHQNTTDTILTMVGIKESLNQATIEYVKDIKSLNIKIATTKDDIQKQQTKCKQIKDELANVTKDIEYSKRLLQRLNENFFKKAEIIDEFGVELESSLNSEEFRKIYKRKLKDLILLIDEIEEVEQTLLENELDRLNILSKLEPYENDLEELQKYLLKIELEKEFVESTKLHDIPKLNSNQESATIVDIEVDKTNDE